MTCRSAKIHASLQGLWVGVQRPNHDPENKGIRFMGGGGYVLRPNHDPENQGYSIGRRCLF